MQINFSMSEIMLDVYEFMVRKAKQALILARWMIKKDKSHIRFLNIWNSKYCTYLENYFEIQKILLIYFLSMQRKQSKILKCIANAPWYISNQKIHKCKNWHPPESCEKQKRNPSR